MEVLTRVDPRAIRDARERGDFLWIDLDGPSAVELQALGDALGLHPAAVEDSIEWDQIAKVDVYPEHLTLVFFSARVTEGAEREAEPVEVHLHASDHFVVTVRRDPCRLAGLHEWLRQSPPDCEDEIVYHILDALADGWDPVVAHLDARVDDLERDVFQRARGHQLQVIYGLKQTVAELLHDAGGQGPLVRVAVDALHDMPGLARGSREWLRDVITHVDAVVADLERLADNLRRLTDTYFNANTNRLNRVATLLAVGGTFFLVWTLITGFFGQNFGWLVDNIDSERDFLIFGLGSLVGTTAVLAVLFWWRRDDWWQ